MNDLEDRLRTDLTAAVDSAAPPLPERSSISATLDRRRRRRHATLLSAAAVLAVGFGLVAVQATMDDDDSDPVISSTTEPTQPTTTSPNSSTTPSTTTSTTAAPPVETPPVALGVDALLGVPFGEDPATAIQRVAQAAEGTVGDDTVERAADVGSEGFPCHGPNGPVVQELRDVIIEGDDVTLRLYIADGVFMGYEVTGSNARYVTPEGVGLGSLEDDLVSAYGDRLTLEPGISEPARWASVPVPGATLPVLFEYDEGGPVNRVVAGGRCAD